MTSPRRLSVSSTASSDLDLSYDSPILPGLDSSAALILVHDDEDDNTHFDFDTDDDEDEENTPQFDVRRASIPPLAPPLVFLYLLTPYLKLGAMFLPHTELPLKYGLAPLFAFAGLSAFSRQIWYMLARYIHTLDFEDVMLDAFARGRGKERRRRIFRSVIRLGTSGLRVMLATVYLRESVYVLLPLFPNDSMIRLTLASILALTLLPLSFAQSLASRRAVHATSLSLVTYLVWLGCTIYAYTHGIPLTNSGWLKMGAFWQGIATIAFAFTTSSTLSLYSSLRGSASLITTVRPSKLRSFKTLSVLSVVLAILLTLPLVIFAANPHVSGSLPYALPPVLIAIPICKAATLLLTIPVLVITTPPLPIPERIRHSTTIPISKILLSVLTLGLALAPAQISVVLSDVLLLSAFTSTYFLPALIHVTAHFFKRPLTIVIPQISRTSPATSTDTREVPHGGIPPTALGFPTDELLLRKERSLQRKQLRKRIVWDLGVWVLLIGGGAGVVWAIGRVAGWW